MVISRVQVLLGELQSKGSEASRAGMARYAINVEQAFGVSVYELRRIAKRLGTDHDLALELWATGNHEARLLACFVDDAARVTSAQMEEWAKGFDSWDLCDQATTSLFDRAPRAWTTARKWARRDDEWVKRGGFAMMAGLAVHDVQAQDDKFCRLFPLIEEAAWDPRNFVKKGVNWALRNIGKRNQALNTEAIACAQRILASESQTTGSAAKRSEDAKAARWVASDALRELSSEKTQLRIQKRGSESR